MFQIAKMYRCNLVLIIKLVLLSCVKQSESSCMRFEKLSVTMNHPDSDFSLPVTAFQAVQTGWEYVTTDEKYNVNMYRYQHYDIFYTLFYQDELVGVAPVYDYREKLSVGGQRELNACLTNSIVALWKRAIEMGRGWTAMFHRILVLDGEEGEIRVQYGMILFVDPEVLKQKGNPPCTQNVVYFKGSHTQWFQVPSQVSDISTQLPQLIQHGCFDQRGNYYFYNLQQNTGWRHYHGFFALYDNQGLLSGFGVMLVGVMNSYVEKIDYPNRQIHSAFQIYTNILLPYKNMIIQETNLSFNSKCASDGLTALHIMTTPRHNGFRCTTHPQL